MADKFKKDMLSKNQMKYINSLQLKKHRREHGVFVAEGNKIVQDLLQSLDCTLIVANKKWIESHKEAVVGEVICATDEEIKKISTQKTPQDVVGIFRQPEYELSKSVGREDICLVLDGIQDPGNLGTIIRIADWFGIRDIVCSHDTTDIYNQKVIQSTMGAIARVRTHYTDIKELLAQNNDLPIYGTLLEGENIYRQEVSENGFIVMGNEGKGVSSEVRKLMNRSLYIPNYPIGTSSSESLNVAVATAIVCSEFRRRHSS